MLCIGQAKEQVQDKLHSGQRHWHQDGAHQHPVLDGRGLADVGDIVDGVQQEAHQRAADGTAQGHGQRVQTEGNTDVAALGLPLPIIHCVGQEQGGEAVMRTLEQAAEDEDKEEQTEVDGAGCSAHAHT